MPMIKPAAAIYAVMRVVDSEICFLDCTDSWDALKDETNLYESREEAYQDARKVSGLCVRLGWKSAQQAGIDHPIWAAQRAAESGDPHVVIVHNADDSTAAA